MDESRKISETCPSCGGSLDGASGNLCPRCLMAKAMQPTVGDGVESSPVPPLGEVVAAFPDLEVLNLIGRGGMGAVFKARQKSLDRHVALKILPQSLAEDPAFQRHFESEAKALAALGHPNIVTIHDFGHQGGFYFLLMEFVDGVNLRELLATRKLSPEEALAIVPQLCEALEFAHGRGIVHRDIKPENLLLDHDGRVKVADFGIAKIIGAVGREGDRAAGTPAYMAPEQAESPGKVDSRADIYSLGVVFYEMLTGERPGEALQPPSNKVAIDLRLDEVVLRALESQPELRWQTAADLRTQIDTIASTPAAAPPTRTESDEWRTTCLTCGNSQTYAEGGGARSKGKRILAYCTGCEAKRKVIVHRANATPLKPEQIVAGKSSLLGVGAFLLTFLGVIATIVGVRFVRMDADATGMAAVQYVPLGLLALGLVLGGAWLFKLRGRPGSRAGWSIALTVLSVVIPFFLLVALTLVWASDEEARRTRAEIETLESAVRQSESKLTHAISIGRSSELVQELEQNHVEAGNRFRAALQYQKARGSGAGRFSWLVIFLLALPFAVAGCALGWGHLGWYRTAPSPRTGFLSAIVSALFWPSIIIAPLLFFVAMWPLKGGRSLEIALQLGLLAALVGVMWLIARAWTWAKNEAEPHPLVRMRTVAGAALILSGVLVAGTLIGDAQDKHQQRVRNLNRTLTTARHELAIVSSEHFKAEAELEGVLVNRPSNPDATDAERREFEDRKMLAERKEQRLHGQVMTIESERGIATELLHQADPWWNEALVPILIGLALVIGGGMLIRSAPER